MEEEKQIQSSQTQLYQLRRLFLPSRAEFAVYFVISTALLAIGAFSAFRSWIGIADAPSGAADILPGGVDQILQKVQESTLLPTLATALFWAAVGGILYIVMWLVSNVFIATRNDIVVVEDYIKPSHYKAAQSAWYQTLESAALRFAALSSIVGLTFVSVAVLLPVYLSQFRAAVLDWQSLSNILQGLLSIVGLIALIHSYIVFLRLLLLRTRIIS